MPVPQTSAAQLEKHLRVLTEDIGVRLAGSEGDRASIDYVRDTFATHVTDVEVEEFAIRQRVVQSESLQILGHDGWQSFPCSLFSSTPGTGGETVEAPLCFFEPRAEYRRPDLGHLKGKAVVHLACHIESRDSYRRLIEAQPAFMLFVDTRYPANAPLADGMFPSYTRALGAVPTLNVPYMAAWDWKAGGAQAARICVSGGMADGTSANVIATLPGDEPELGTIYVGGHHDTQADSPGADDNGTGTVSLIELARVLSGRTRRRPIKLISFGAEEQLSVGSAEYVRRHRAEVTSQGRFIWNFDSCGSHLGWTIISTHGNDRLSEWLAQWFESRDIWTQPERDVVPYADHFPFSAAGVPGAWLSRRNCAGGRFFHHRSDDDISRISFPELERLATATAGLLDQLGDSARLPFPGEIVEEQATQIREHWDDLYGGWEAT